MAGLTRRTFASYDEYVHEQGRKARTQRATLLAKLPRETRGFAKTFRAAAAYLVPGPVLCLGARTGAEALGAIEAGFAGSVGIDLHPIGPDVLQADWHALPFADGAFPNIYTNSLDHCLDLDRLAAQVRRVLTADGRFYVMATNRQDAGHTREHWLAKGGIEALFWQTSDDLCAAIRSLGFDVAASWKRGTWGHYVLRPIR